MLSKFKRNKHQQHLAQLPKISQSVDDVDFFYAPADFRETLLEKIASTYAARICNELQVTEGGKTYGDWYLPSKEELNLMYQNKATIDATAGVNGGSGFASAGYWSSTEYDNRRAWGQYFDDGSQSTDDKQYVSNYVRAVRAF
jgi:hypothetical protein